MPRRQSAVALLIKRLIAAGTDPELAAVVVIDAFTAGTEIGKSNGTPVDKVAERRRAYDRDWKAKIRNSAGLPTGNPPDDETAHSSSLAESESPKEVKKERKKPNRGHPLATNFKPSADHYNFATTEGIGYDLVDRKCAELHLWARANAHSPKARKADWSSAFMSWLRTLATERQANDRRTYNRSITGSEPIIAAASRKFVDNDRYRVFGGPPSVSLPGGIELTAEDRVNVETQILRLEHEIDPNYPFETGGDLPRNARLRSLTVPLLAYSVGTSSELGNAAKFDMYDVALYDLPVWICNAAIRKWNRGEAGIAGANCQFPPAPGVLRQIADNEIKVYIVRIA